MKSKITSLQKFGLSQISAPLKFKSDDTVFQKFYKTAKYIHRTGVKNNDFEKSDYILATRQQLLIRGYSKLDINKPVEISSKDEDSSIVNGLKLKKNYWVYQAQDNKHVIIDPNDSRIGNHMQSGHWRYSKSDWKTKGSFIVVNGGLALGYNKLYRNIYNNMISTGADKKYGFDRNSFKDYMKTLTDPYYRKYKDKFSYKPELETFDKAIKQGIVKSEKSSNQDMYVLRNPETGEIMREIDTSYFNRSLQNSRISKYVNDYIDDTNDYILQKSYDTQNALGSHAKFFQNKKHVNKETQKAAVRLSNELPTFKNVEIDNEVDLAKLDKISPSIKELANNVLPKTNNKSAPILRFRKLRNHNALGIYTPVNDTIAVDFREDEGGIGIQSFVHEYGHYLDYNTKNGDLRSLSPEFKPILKNAQAFNDNLVKNKKVTPSQASYLDTPTEIFARSFEAYASNCGLNNSLIKDKDVYTDLKNSKYGSFVNNEALNEYFDKEFPDFRKNIQKYMNEEKDLQDSKTQVVSNTPLKAQNKASEKITKFEQIELF